MTEAIILPSSSPTKNKSGRTACLRKMSFCGSFHGRTKSQLSHSEMTAASSPVWNGRICMACLGHKVTALPVFTDSKAAFSTRTAS